MILDKLAIAAQSVLDDLWSEKLIPFQLTAHKVEFLGMDEYIVRFYDSRLHSVDVSSDTYDSFRHAFRVNVLARVGKLDGPRAQSLRPKGLLTRNLFGNGVNAIQALGGLEIA